MSKRKKNRPSPKGHQNVVGREALVPLAGLCAQVRCFVEHGLMPQETRIQWSCVQRSFDVSYKTSLDGATLTEVHRTIPLEIAEHSRCACGGRLSLGDYSITTVQKDLVFAANYFCSNCKNTIHQKQSGIAATIQRFFSTLKSFKIGPLGIEVSDGKTPKQ